MQKLARSEKSAAYAADSGFLEAVLHGLSLPQKTLPSRFLYDEAGSALFERITELPEYYPTRTEIALLNSCGGESETACRAEPRLWNSVRVPAAKPSCCSEPSTAPAPTYRSIYPLPRFIPPRGASA